MKRLAIGDLATAARVPTSTVRYYERAGLVKPASRSEANYRLYDQEAVERLCFIRSAQAAGLTLADIRSLLEYRDGTATPCGPVRELIEHRLSLIEEKLGQLNEVRDVLKSYLQVCKQAEAKEPCKVLEEIEPDPTTSR